MTSRPFRFSLCALILLLAYGGLPLLGAASVPSAPASAAALVPPTPGRTLVDYLRGEIRSDDPARREHALMDVVTLVNCRDYCVLELMSFPGKTLRIHNDADFGSVIDVSALAPDLVWAYQVGPTDGLRLLALAGLLYIGDEARLEHLLTASMLVSSPYVRRTTHRYITDFFVARYPMLEKQVRRTRVLSRAHIRAARKTAQPYQEERLTTRPPPPPR